MRERLRNVDCAQPPLDRLVALVLPRVIITYGACARGGGRRPGFEASDSAERPT